MDFEDDNSSSDSSYDQSDVEDWHVLTADGDVADEYTPEQVAAQEAEFAANFDRIQSGLEQSVELAKKRAIMAENSGGQGSSKKVAFFLTFYTLLLCF